MGRERLSSRLGFILLSAGCAIGCGNAREISAMVPLANMFGYVNILRSMSQGRAQFSMVFDHYDQVPQQISDEIKSKMS